MTCMLLEPPLPSRRRLLSLPSPPCARVLLALCLPVCGAALSPDRHHHPTRTRTRKYAAHPARYPAQSSRSKRGDLSFFRSVSRVR